MFPCNYASVCIRDFLLLDFRSVYSAAGAMLPGAGRMEDVLMMCLESKKGGPQGRSRVCAGSLTSQLGGQEGRHPSKILSTFPPY